MCLDGYMNIALEQTEEYVNGQVCNETCLKSIYNVELGFPWVDLAHLG